MIRSLQKDNRAQSFDDCTFISSDYEQDHEEQSINSFRTQDQAETFDIGKLQKRTISIREHQFMSISSYYEALVASQIKPSYKSLNPINNVQQDESQIYECFCLKRLRLSSYFVAHIEEFHGGDVQSLDYLCGQIVLKRYGLYSRHFKSTQSQYLDKIEAKDYKQLSFTHEMKLVVSNNLKSYIKKQFKSLLRLPIPPQNFYMSFYKLTLSHPKPYLFSQQFMQGIRGLLIKHVTIFDRRIDCHVKNMSLRDSFLFFLFGLQGLFVEVKKESFGKWSRNRPVYQMSNLLECIGRHFLSWTDDCYLKVLQKYGIYCSHIQLQTNEKYSQVARIWKCELFLKEYFKSMQTKYIGDTVLSFVKFFVEVFQTYSQQLNQRELNIFLINQKEGA